MLQMFNDHLQFYNGFNINLYEHDCYTSSGKWKTKFLQAFFEVMSAFGTCGLSLGITGDVSSTTKLILMLLMFIGRVGLISFIIMIGGRREPDKFHYPKERVQIG